MKFHCAKKDEPDILPALREFLSQTDDSWNYILPSELEKKLGDKKLFILDVRKPEDYAEGHVAGATNIFWLDLLDPKSLKKLPMDKTIVVVCYVGHTASQAVVLLKLLGYKAVGLKFGMGRSPVKGVPVAGWLDYGFDVEEGK